MEASALKHVKVATCTEVDCSSFEYLDFPEVPANAPVKPNKQYFVHALLDGTPVGIHDIRNYEIFFKLFQRACAYEKKKLKLTRRQISPTLWLLIPRKPSEPKPDSLITGTWREHGRYKYRAQQLDRGETVTVEDEREARKTRRAWMLYVRPEQRQGRECVIELRGNDKYRLRVVSGS